MKHPFKSHFTFVLTLLALAFSALGVTPTLAAESKNLPPVKNFLNQNGTLNLATGYAGNLDISRYEITLDPARGPIFRLLSISNTWNSLGSTPLNNKVIAIAINGTDVYAGGYFTNAGGDPNADYIAKWNGSTWSALGTTPLNNWVTSITINGTDVYAGGVFTGAGGNPKANSIAKWNGSTWSDLETTLWSGSVEAIAISGMDVYVGGNFYDMGNVTNANFIAKWNGSSWSKLGAIPLNGEIRDIVISGTDLYAGGSFTDAGGDPNADYIAKWNGATWSALGNTPLNSGVITVEASGTDLYVGGLFTDAGGNGNADYIAKWNGSVWSSLGNIPLNSGVITVEVNGSDLYAGGLFANAGDNPNADYIAKWNGSTWSALTTTPVNERLFSIATSGTDLYIGGYVTDAGGDPNADYIARLDLSNIPENITPSFTDVPDTYWAFSFVERLYNAGITSGCGTGTYCPDNTVTRAEMAVFLLRGMHGSSFAPPAINGVTNFTDVVTSHWAAAWIKQLAAEGITSGCGAGIYCPDSTVTRAQMAVFLLKAKHGASYAPPAINGSTGFTDVSTKYWAAAWIKQLAAEGVTSGCGNGNFCPDNSVTRAEMAVFLAKAFGLP